MKRLASSCICANGLCTTLPSIDNVSMKVKGLSCGRRSAVAKGCRREGVQERSIWTRMFEIKIVSRKGAIGISDEPNLRRLFFVEY